MPATEPTVSASSFAGFLTRLAAPAAKSADIWNDDDLGDDIVTLSYEQALSTHARVRPPSPPILQDTGLPDISPLDTNLRDSCQAAPASVPATAAAGSASRLPPLEESRKSSSVTIRLSHAECEQLRKRAAAAGLTVSAYLRSCIFEVEALRSQVKDTLAQLRSEVVEETVPQKAKAEPARAAVPVQRWHVFSRLRWLFFPRWAANQRVAHA
jgi:hypothetical protein